MYHPSEAVRKRYGLRLRCTVRTTGGKLSREGPKADGGGDWKHGGQLGNTGTSGEHLACFGLLWWDKVQWAGGWIWNVVGL